MVVVFEIVPDTLLDFFTRIGFAASAVDLGPSGNAGFNFVAGEITVDHRFIKYLGGFRLGGVRVWSQQ